jgi:hypothetical protein
MIIKCDNIRPNHEISKDIAIPCLSGTIFLFWALTSLSSVNEIAQINQSHFAENSH